MTYDAPVAPELAADITTLHIWAKEVMSAADVDAMLDFLHKAPAAHESHPHMEHFAPLFVSLGAAYES